MGIYGGRKYSFLMTFLLMSVITQTYGQYVWAQADPVEEVAEDPADVDTDPDTTPQPTLVQTGNTEMDLKQYCYDSAQDKKTKTSMTPACTNGVTFKDTDRVLSAYDKSKPDGLYQYIARQLISDFSIDMYKYYMGFEQNIITGQTVPSGYPVCNMAGDNHSIFYNQGGTIADHNNNKYDGDDPKEASGQKNIYSSFSECKGAGKNNKKCLIKTAITKLFDC